MNLHRFTASLELVPDAPTGRLSGLVVPYGQPANRFGGPIVFQRGCLSLPARLSDVKLLIQHDDDRPAGYAVEAAETDAGLRMSFQLADHPRATDLQAEIDALLRDGLSVGVEPDDTTMAALSARLWAEAESDDPIVFAGALREVSAVSVPQYTDARADAALTGVVTFSTERNPMPPTTVTDPPDPTPEVTVFAGDVITPPPAPTLTELAAAVSTLLGAPTEPAAHPLSRFASFTEYADAVRADPRLQLALADQTTVDNAALVQPAWLTQIVGIIDQGSPVATALAGALPNEGMEIRWPVYSGNYKTLVAKVLAEKTPIHSEKVSIGSGGPAAVETFAGGSDISYQLIKRSSPSYQDAYNQIMALAYAWCTEAVVSTALIAASAESVDLAADADAQAVKSALFAASALVRNATGNPATLVFAGTDQFGRLGSLPGLENPTYGTQNVAGTSSAATLEVNVNGLQVIEAPAFPADAIIVTNKLAAQYLREGPYTVTAEDVEKLGQNVAVWGMGAFCGYRPAGIVELAPPTLP